MLADVPQQVLRITFVRFVICAIRFVWYAKIRRRLQVLDAATGDVSPNTITHNMRGMFDFSVERSLRLIQPLTALERVRTRVRETRLLSIGARTEGELYNLYSFGFVKRNVTAVDLISYSPRVSLGDMHSLNFADDSFDVTIVGWVIAYSDNKQKAADEIVRVTRPGGVVAIGVEWSARSEQEVAAEIGYFPGSEHRIAAMDDLLALFDPHVGARYFEQNERDCAAVGSGDLIVLFSVAK